MVAEAPQVTTALDADAAAHAHRLVQAATAADGVAPLSEQADLAIDAAAGPHAGPHAAGSTADPDSVESDATASADSAPPVQHVVSAAGYANITPGRPGEPAMIEAVVDPGQRRRGHGRALLDAAFAAARGTASASDVPAPRAWAHGDLPGARALAAAMGLRAHRELLQLRRHDASTLPPLQVPADIVLRGYAGPDDDAELLRVNNAAFAWHPEQGGWTRAQIAERVAADWFDPAGLILAFDAADPTRLLGFHWTKVAEPGLGEVYIVGVDPAAQGRGLGRLLTLAGLHHLADRGIGEVLLYVEGDNTAALHTYSRLGFDRFAVDVAYG